MDNGAFGQALNKAVGISVEDSEIRNILIKYFAVESEENAGYKAAALEAVESAVAVLNMFMCIRKSDSARSVRMFADLTLTLNSNQFWARNASAIVPMLQSALFEHFDDAELKLAKAQNSNYTLYDALSYSSKVAPLNIVSYMLYLLGGPKLSLASSLPLKQELYKYFVG